MQGSHRRNQDIFRLHAEHLAALQSGAGSGSDATGHPQLFQHVRQEGVGVSQLTTLPFMSLVFLFFYVSALW